MESIAVLVNLRARRGSTRIGELVRRHLPRARVAVTSSLEEARRWLSEELAPAPPTLLLSGGGDGTAVALLNELRARSIPLPTLGVLPLGTGNGWANVTGAPSAGRALARIAGLHGRAPPLRHFALVESEGRIAHFVGTGWDAEIVSDFHAQLAGQPAALKGMSSGLYGYLKGMFTRTIPRHLTGPGPARVRVINLGEPALTVDRAGRVVPLPGGETGAVLYDGPASVAAAATTEEWGFRFRSFPFAHAAPGRLSARVYGGTVLEATGRALQLWRGVHPMPKMHDFLLTAGRMEFDREVPFQVGGDPLGPRRAFEFRFLADGVNLVDWRRMPRH